MPSTAALRGVLGVLQHPGPQFWGPQLVEVVSWLQVCKGPAFGTAPGPALALMRPCCRVIKCIRQIGLFVIVTTTTIFLNNTWL